ncbi:hypothetical protein AM493_19195 [Flavobacterium akiainvivens]|uniref:Uncharacterized protein n=2 Tax=Flavobacterium akiainvivens TaxID=1202724 RepID=A0A0M9VK36_9FLAO|nr:hypothetical protein AM493_19195 [Flavobacterium akiainvivens]
MGAGLLLAGSIQSCSTYNMKSAEIETDLLAGNYPGALAHAGKNKFLKKKRNELLFLMEKGRLEHLNGNYEESNRIFEQAYIIIDDRIKTNAGQAVAAKLTNPMAEPYKGEDFEKVTLHYYKALNYIRLGLPNEALVEAKRINIKLDELNLKYPEGKKNKYRVDAFSLIIEGLLYENTGDINGAFISYRNAYEIYAANGNSYYGVPLPEQLKKDLLRTSKQLGFTQEYNEYAAKFGLPAEVAQKQPAEAVIIWENGLGPAKDQIMLTLSGTGDFFYASYMEDGKVIDILLPIPLGTDLGTVNALAIPKYRKRDNYYTHATLVVNGNEVPIELAQDFYPIAKECLNDRMLREILDMALRFAAKKGASMLLGAIAEGVAGGSNDKKEERTSSKGVEKKEDKTDANDIGRLIGDIAGAVTEKADTRNWQSLPATINYIRVPLQQGNNTFTIKKYGKNGYDTQTITIPYKPGLQILNYADISHRAVPAPATAQPAVSTE